MAETVGEMPEITPDKLTGKERLFFDRGDSPGYTTVADLQRTLWPIMGGYSYNVAGSPSTQDLLLGGDYNALPPQMKTGSNAGGMELGFYCFNVPPRKKLYLEQLSAFVYAQYDCTFEIWPTNISAGFNPNAILVTSGKVNARYVNQVLINNTGASAVWVQLQLVTRRADMTRDTDLYGYSYSGYVSIR